jgi:hypothetical protein
VAGDWPDWAPTPDPDDETAFDAGAAAAAYAARPAGPVNWRELGPADAEVAWRDLRAWVDWFRTRLGLDHRVVPPCWYHHPALVDLLSAVHDHWREAYQRTSPRSAGADWHRALIGLEQRLRDWAARTGCTPTLHRPDVVAEPADDTDAWQRHVAEDRAARHRTGIPAQPL